MNKRNKLCVTHNSHHFWRWHLTYVWSYSNGWFFFMTDFRSFIRLKKKFFKSFLSRKNKQKKKRNSPLFKTLVSLGWVLKMSNFILGVWSIFDVGSDILSMMGLCQCWWLLISKVVTNIKRPLKDLSFSAKSLFLLDVIIKKQQSGTGSRNSCTLNVASNFVENFKILIDFKIYYTSKLQF